MIIASANQAKLETWMRRRLRRVPGYSILGDRVPCPKCDALLSLRMTRQGPAWFCGCPKPRVVRNGLEG